MSKQLYLVGVDGSEWAQRAAERAVNLAVKTGANVKFVYVLDWSGLQLQPVMMEGVAPTLPDKDEEKQKIYNKVMQPLTAQFSDIDVKLTSEVIWGDPAYELHKLAKSEHAHMLFLGRRGRSRFMDALLGSVANKLAHNAGIPIVLVP